MMTDPGFTHMVTTSTQSTGVTQTLGQRRVRHTFNPGSNPLVDAIKLKTAELIDLVEENKVYDPRLAALAQTHYEDAAMWAVKLVTS